MRLFSTATVLAVGAMTAMEVTAQDNTIFGQPEFEEVEIEEQAAIEHSETTWYPHTFYSALDFSMGLMLGFYSPVQKRWRNWDCRSQFFGMAMNIVNYSKYFDKPYEVTVGGLLGTTMQLT